MSRMPRYEAFSILEMEDAFAVGKTLEGKVREFSFVVHRDRATNKLTLDVVPHYTDPESSPAFPVHKPEPWTEEERLGQA